MSLLKIAVVSETYPPEVNGVAMTLQRMVGGMLARGHQLHLIRPRQAGEIQAAPFEYFQETLVPGIPLPGYRGLRFGLPLRRRLQRLWQEDRPDVVQVVTEGPLGAAAIGAACRLRIPVLSEFHTNFHAYSRHYGVGWLAPLIAAHLRRLHNRGDLTLVPTHSLADELAADGYRRLRVVARGIDTRLFNPGRRSRELRRSWGVGDGDLVAVCVGRVAAEKNLPLAFEALAKIRRQQPKARLLLVGDGPLLRKLSARSDAAQAIFVGVRHAADLAQHYASADLFLFPSLTETFGNVVPEALASGLPVVAYHCAAAADLIHQGDNGRTVPAGDSLAFIEAAVALATGLPDQSGRRWDISDSVAHLDWEQIYDRQVEELKLAMRYNARAKGGADSYRLLPD